MTERNQKGSITVFLSLIMILLISLFAVSLESAHMAAVRGQISLKSNAVMEDLFSRYERSLYEKYRLLFLNVRQNPERILSDGMKEAGSPEVLKESGVNHLQFQAESVEIHQTIGLLDSNAEAFQKEVRQIAGGDMVSAFWNKISGNLEKLEHGQTESGEINQFLETEQKTEEVQQEGAETEKTDGQEETDGKQNLSEEEKERALSIAALINTVKKWITDGFFSLIVDNTDELSGRIVDNRDMPSQDAPKKKERTGNILENAVDRSVDAVTMNWYLSQYLDCYTDHGTYDLEYVIGDKRTDSDNLKTVVNQLVLLRQVLNLSYLAGDETKKAEAELAAEAVLTVLGIPAAAKVGEYLILTAWAYAEAISDVRILVKGGKVAFLKNSENWKLLLDQAVDFRNWTEHTGDSKEGGFEYKEYLMLLLFFHSHQRNMYRGLDMIQWDLMQTDPGFRVKDCIYGINAEFRLYVKPVFLSGSAFYDKNGEGVCLEHQEYYAYE